MGTEEIRRKIKEIEDEITRTPYNKASERHIGTLRGKIAALKDKIEVIQAKKTLTTGYNVKKTGDATVVLVGFPSVGKSTLINKLTNVKSKVAHHAFTTLTSIPGTMQYKNMDIQIVDLPGIIEGASEGRGRGKEVISVVRSADLVITILDANDTVKTSIIQEELYKLGIRLDSKKANVKIEKTMKGGIDIGLTVKLTKISKETIKAILRENGFVNANVVIREDITMDRFIDVISKNVYYIPSVLIINKVDMIDEKQAKELRKKFPGAVFISAEQGKNLERLKDRIIEKLGFIRIFLKRPNLKPDMNEPMIIRKEEATVEGVCNKIHTSFAKKLNFAKIWGGSARFGGQQVGKTHVLIDKDIIEFHWL